MPPPATVMVELTPVIGDSSESVAAAGRLPIAPAVRHSIAIVAVPDATVPPAVTRYEVAASRRSAALVVITAPWVPAAVTLPAAKVAAVGARPYIAASRISASRSDVVANSCLETQTR